MSRLVSLDVFRGITIAAMLLVNNPGRGTPYAPLEHAEWNGWTVTDLIFPFFLFIVGVAVPFSFAKRDAAAYLTTGQRLARIWSRGLSLVLLGILLGASRLVWPFGDVPAGFGFSGAMRIVGFVFVLASILLLLTPLPWKSFSRWMPLAIGGLLLIYLVAMHFVRQHALAHGWAADAFGSGAFDPATLRLPGVLQRIGICYAVAASLAVFLRWRGLLLCGVVLCGLYSVLMLKTPFPGKPDAVGGLTKEANFARFVDEFVFDRKAADGTYLYRHAYRSYPDPEGIVSTLPAVATVIIGIIVGTWLRTERPRGELVAGLLCMGLVGALLGLWLDRELMPINKSLWTPSFTVFTAGMGMVGLGFVYWLIEVCNRRLWAWPFKVMGMNAIAAFVLAVLLVRISSWIRLTEPATGKDVPALSYLNSRIIDGMHVISAKWQSISPHLGPIDTPQNNSLAYALAFVLIAWVVMWVMYVCRFFAKI